MFFALLSATLVLKAQQSCARVTGCLSKIPGKPEFHTVHSTLYTTYSNGLRGLNVRKPAAVVFPDTIQQVQAAVLCAVRAKVRPIPRSGACSFENLGSGDGAVVVDLTNMAQVRADLSSMTAVVQTGIRSGNLYTKLHQAGEQLGKNITALGGVWPQVGFGGLMAAGGYGSMSRMYGVLADHVVAAKVVDAKGRLLEASPTVNPDLFFAIRGGGGGTYGIVVEATIKLIEVPIVTVAVLAYPNLSNAVQIMKR
jgi:FAD/FMN-containing dehydrogenase